MQCQIVDGLSRLECRGYDSVGVVIMGEAKASDAVTPFLRAVAVQMVAYFSAFAKSKDLAQPKNLAKSVTF